jgi:hypothetical protein
MKGARYTVCDNCPFRSDKPFYLARGRIEEIFASDSHFNCHKTIDYSTDPPSDRNALVCAGYLILCEKRGEYDQMTRIMGRLGMFDPAKLDKSVPVYDSVEEADAACSRLDTRRSDVGE